MIKIDNNYNIAFLPTKFDINFIEFINIYTLNEKALKTFLDDCYKDNSFMENYICTDYFHGINTMMEYEKYFIDMDYIEKNRYDLRKKYLTYLIKRLLTLKLENKIFSFENMNIYFLKSKSDPLLPLYDDLNYNLSNYNNKKNSKSYILNISERQYIQLYKELLQNFTFNFILYNMVFIDLFSNSDLTLEKRLLNMEYSNMYFSKKDITLSRSSYKDKIEELKYFYNIDLISFFKIRNGDVIFGEC